MSLLSRLHGAHSIPLRQQLRRTDGVRGVFSLKPLKRGELILSLPLHYCYVTHLGHDAQHPPGWTSTAEGARQLRRWNRGVALLPEAWTWLERFSSDAATDGVALTSSVSADIAVTSRERDPPLSCSPSIFSLTLSPVEAALATAIALRYFYGRALHLSPATRRTRHIGPAPNALAEGFVDSLPLEAYMRTGVEALYGDAASGEAHLCLEQLAQNLCDAVLTHANAEEYHFLDAFPFMFDNLLLVCMYVVRARVLTVPLFGRVSQAKEEKVCGVFAPLLDSLNHAAVLPSAAAVVALSQQRVVVRATRDLRRGEEITLHYQAAGPLAHVAATSSPYEMSMDEDWASRYLMEREG